MHEQSWWLFCACTRLSCSRKSFANISVSFATIPVLISFAGRPFRSWPTHFLIRIDWRSATKEESTSGNIEALQEKKNLRRHSKQPTITSNPPRNTTSAKRKYDKTLYNSNGPDIKNLLLFVTSPHRRTK